MSLLLIWVVFVQDNIGQSQADCHVIYHRFFIGQLRCDTGLPLVNRRDNVINTTGSNVRDIMVHHDMGTRYTITTSNDPTQIKLVNNHENILMTLLFPHFSQVKS